jgi:hypothetical protein
MVDDSTVKDKGLGLELDQFSRLATYFNNSLAN